MDSINNIKKWADDGTELGVIKWEELPDIKLYMDQVIGFLTEKLEFFKEDEVEKKKSSFITSSMINNYVKSGVIEHPQQKKYSKEQISQLVIISMLKQVLSIPDLKTLLSEVDNMEKFYSDFERTQTDAMNEVSSQVRFAAENGDDMKLLAMRFAAQSKAKRAAAAEILAEFGKDKNS